MTKKIIALLLVACGASFSASVALAFEESPALPERFVPGGEGRQRALPEQFASVSSPAWADEAPVVWAGTRELMAAVKAGALDDVKKHLNDGALPNGADENGQRPLLAAVAEGHAEIARLLLQRGASPNIKGPQGRTPLSMAAAAGHLGLVRILLRADADIDARSDNRATALHEAIRFDRPDIVRAIAAAKPNPASYDREGLHPLALAAATGHLRCLKNLLDAGLSPDQPDRTGLTALYWARRYDQALAESLLIESGASRDAWPIVED